MRVTTYITLEIELALSATYSPARPATGPSYSSGGDPPEDARVDDVAVEGLGVVSLVQPPLHERGSHRLVHKTFDALDGVNINSPDVQRLLANLLALSSNDAEYALLMDGEQG